MRLLSCTEFFFIQKKKKKNSVYAGGTWESRNCVNCSKPTNKQRNKTKEKKRKLLDRPRTREKAAEPFRPGGWQTVEGKIQSSSKACLFVLLSATWATNSLSLSSLALSRCLPSYDLLKVARRR